MTACLLAAGLLVIAFVVLLFIGAALTNAVNSREAGDDRRS